MLSSVTKGFTAASGQQRERVLDLYRRLMRVAKDWTSATNDARQNAEESAYIRQEARSLFRKNAHLTDPQVIEVRTVV